MIELNLRGTAWACRAVAPVMRRPGAAGSSTSRRSAPSSVSSTGLPTVRRRARWRSSRCLALEWGPYGITVNAVGPGITVTPLVRPFLDANPGKEETMTRKIPLGRLGRGRHGGRRRLPRLGPGGVRHRADDLRRRRVGRWRPRLVRRRATGGLPFEPFRSVTRNPCGRPSARATSTSSPGSPATSRCARGRGVRQGHAVRRAHRPRRAPGGLRVHGDGADDRTPAAPGGVSSGTR